MKRFIVIHLLVLLSLAALVACSRGRQVNERKAITSTLEGREMVAEGILPGEMIAAYRDYLFLREERDTSRLVVYQVSDDSLKYFKGLIDKGRGPREFLYTEYSLYGDTLFVSNGDPFGMKQIFGIPLTDMSVIDNKDQWKEYTFPDPQLNTWQVYTGYGPGRFVVAGGERGAETIFTLADCLAGECTPIQYWPADTVQLQANFKQQVYMDCYMRSQGDRICYSHLYARYMFIGKVDDGVMAEKALVYSNLPKYKVDSDGLNVSYVDKKNAGIDIYSTADYIYALLERTPEEIRKSESYKGYGKYSFDEIEVYDWDGVFVANYQTDKPFYDFVVSPDNHYLYTIAEDPELLEYVITRYELPL